MRILLTNDDGILAPGLVAICRELHAIGEVTLVAPTTPQSAVGHAISVSQPLFCQETDVAEGLRGWSVDGRPADCVKLAVLELMKDAPPDLVVSGINAGENVGINVLYSGTVAAAIEGAFYGLPSVAVSLAYSDRMDFRAAARLARDLIEALLARSRARSSVVNMNLPDVSAGPPRGVRVCRMDIRPIEETMTRRADPRGRPYYWITGGSVPEGDAHPESDQVALAEGYVTLTPLAFDLTDAEGMKRLRDPAVTLPAAHGTTGGGP
jgi:5'-nucleotidase